jgi:hypothetical protein
MFSRLSKDLRFRSPTYIDHCGKLFTVSPTVGSDTLKGHYSADMNRSKENEMPHVFSASFYTPTFGETSDVFHCRRGRLGFATSTTSLASEFVGAVASGRSPPSGKAMAALCRSSNDKVWRVRHAHDTGWLGAKYGMELARDLRRLPQCGGSGAGFLDAAGAGATSVNDLRARPCRAHWISTPLFEQACKASQW